MLPFLVALASAPSSEPQVAFVARFYYPPGDNRISHQHVYLCRLNGSGRHLLKIGNKEPSEVHWLGRDRLLVTFSEDSAVYDLRKKRVVRHLPRTEFVETLLAIRGHVLVNDEGKELLANGRLRDYALPWTETPISTGLKYRTPKGHMISCDPKDDFDRLGDMGSMPLRYVFNGKMKEVGESGVPNTLIAFRGKCYLRSYSSSGATWANTWYYDVDFEAGKSDQLFYGGGVIDFDPGSRFWSVVDGGKHITPYGKTKQVWTQEINVGDLKTGHEWTIAKGLVFGQYVQIRPGV